VPPETVDVNPTAVFTEPEAGPPILAVRIRGEMATSWKLDAVLLLASVTVSVTLKVPLTENIVEKVEAVPVDGLPPVTAQAYVYGVVPPETIALNPRKVLTLPEVGPLIDAIRVSAEILTSWKVAPVLPL
jgi:hypothetical protein